MTEPHAPSSVPTDPAHETPPAGTASAPHVPEPPAEAEAEPLLPNLDVPKAAAPMVEPVAAPVRTMMPPPAAEPAPRATPVWLTAVVAIVLLIGLYLVWNDRPVPDAPRIAALETALRTAQSRIEALESRPVPAPAPPPDTARIAAVEAKLQELASRPAPDPKPLESRLAALENRPPPPVPDVAGAVASASAGLNAKIASLDTKLQQDMAEAAARASRASRLRAATVALEAGQPVGAIDGAPPVLQRYAAAPPPTEPALRLSFAAAAGAAEAASRPSAEGHGFAERMWMKAQQLVTVRQGDKVLVGAPAAVTLAAARGRLDAGDLAGAVAALAPLDAGAAAAMAPWKAEAQALLDARAALASLAAKS